MTKRPCNGGDPGDPCSVQNPRTLGECSNVPSFPQNIKVPVVLAEPTVQVCVEADIILEEAALEIKRVLKDVFVEQCKLVPTAYPRTFKLFLGGTIRKNIEYSTIDTVNGTSVCGDIRHTTVHVPWECCTDLTFPLGARLPELFADNEQRFEFLDKKGMQPQIEKRLFRNFKFFNEQPFCELVQVLFHELDMGHDLVRVNEFEKSFQRLREKIVMNLTVKVLQVQQVARPPLPTPTPTTTPTPTPTPWPCLDEE